MDAHRNAVFRTSINKKFLTATLIESGVGVRRCGSRRDRVQPVVHAYMRGYGGWRAPVLSPLSIANRPTGRVAEAFNGAG